MILWRLHVVTKDPAWPWVLHYRKGEEWKTHQVKHVVISCQSATVHDPVGRTDVDSNGATCAHWWIEGTTQGIRWGAQDGALTGMVELE